MIDVHRVDLRFILVLTLCFVAKNNIVPFAPRFCCSVTYPVRTAGNPCAGHSTLSAGLVAKARLELEHRLEAGSWEGSR